MNRRDRFHLPRFRTDARLARLAVAFLAAGALLAGLELVLLGRVTTPAMGLGAIGAALVFVGALADMIAPGRLGGAEPGGEEEEEDGGGGGGRIPDPLPPSGGLGIDWERFEAEFRAYADGRTAAPGLVSVP